MKNLFFFLCVGAIFYTALDSSLTDMTKADCHAGIQLACEQIKK
tara:strand:+ start:81 stop:212 length:132 start_codon:yes stop_codon:yes gene_type:complete